MSGSRLHPFVVTNTPNVGAPLDHSAAIELADKNKGLLPNRLATAQRDAITNPANGLLIFNTTLGAYQFYNGIDWTSISTGMVKLASGTITTPLAYVDLALPAGYTRFRIEIAGLHFNDANDMSGALSFDGGTTFPADTTNFDTYVIVVNRVLGLDSLTTTFNDSVMDTPFSPLSVTDSKFGANITIDLWPGSDSEYPAVHLLAGLLNADGNYCSAFVVYTLNPAATISPPLARADLYRFQPYGNADFPPTSGETITAGSYILWGIAP